MIVINEPGLHANNKNTQRKGGIEPWKKKLWKQAERLGERASWSVCMYAYAYKHIHITCPSMYAYANEHTPICIWAYIPYIFI